MAKRSLNMKKIILKNEKSAVRARSRSADFVLGPVALGKTIRKMIFSQHLTTAVISTGAGAGVDSVREQRKLEARKILENAAESPASSARFVGQLCEENITKNYTNNL